MTAQMLAPAALPIVWRLAVLASIAPACPHAIAKVDTWDLLAGKGVRRQNLKERCLTRQIGLHTIIPICASNLPDYTPLF